MRDVFHGYFPPTPDERRDLLESSLIVLDTNALLNLYRYTKESREQLLSALKSLSSRMWMPHHVGVEFHRRRIGLIKAQLRLGDDLLNAYNEIAKVVDGQLGKHSKNAFIDTREMIAELKSAISTASDRVQGLVRSRIGEYGVEVNSDPLMERIAMLYQGRVGAAFTPDEWEEVRREGDHRYEQEIPPGYLDNNKTGDQKYGDLVIWKQLLKHAAEVKAGVIFVTDDAKDDWWWKADGMTIGPRPELRSEFRDHTGRDFYAYRAEHFVAILKENQSLGVSAETVQEVRETSRRIEDAEQIQKAVHALEEEYRIAERSAVHAQARRDEAAARMDSLRAAGAQSAQAVRDRSMTELAIFDHDLMRLERRLAALLRPADQLENTLDSFDSVVTAQEIAEVREKIATLSEQKSGVLAHISTLESQAEKIKRQYAVAERQAWMAEAELDAAYERYVRLRDRVAELKTGTD